MLESMTHSQLIAAKAEEAENIRKLLLSIPVPMGKVIVVG